MFVRHARHVGNELLVETPNSVQSAAEVESIIFPFSWQYDVNVSKADALNDADLVMLGLGEHCVHHKFQLLRGL